jgi:hypothetical protein
MRLWTSSSASAISPKVCLTQSDHCIKNLMVKLQMIGDTISITGRVGRKKDAKASGLGARELTLFRSLTIYRGRTTSLTTKQEQTTVCKCES